MKYAILLCLLLAGKASATDFIIISDSIGLGSLPYVESQVSAQHNTRCPYFQDYTTGDTDNAGSSAREAACINIWLANGTYKYVHFNAGMHDVHIIGCKKGFTSHQVELSDYLNNLQIIIDAIRASGATPIFATTTPIEGGTIGVACHFNADIIAYNAAAVSMMQSEGIQVDDLYSAVYPNQGYFHGPKGIHFTDNGYNFIGHRIVNFFSQLP